MAEKLDRTLEQWNEQPETKKEKETEKYTQLLYLYQQQWSFDNFLTQKVLIFDK